jgi:hypothetical protein
MSVFTELDHEWRYLGSSPAARQRLRTWATDAPALTDYAHPAALVVDANRRGNPPRSDQLLVAVTRHATGGDDLASRTLLQALLPGLKAIARRYRPIVNARGQDTDSLVIAYAWEQICCFPLERRPRRIAANILYDTQQQLHRSINRPTPALVPIEAITHEPAAPPTGDDPRAWLEHAVARGVLTPDEARLIAVTRLGYGTIADLAHVFDCDPATLRRRRRRAEDRLASVHY